MNQRYLLLIIALLLFPARLPALEAPMLTGRVTDLARMLSPESQQRLEQKLAAFERETSNQVVVLTVPSLQGDDIAAFSIRVADAWKIGQKGRDNGVLLVIAREERKVRIEVGLGLQGVLPDITAGQIIRDVMRPYLKSGNYDQGITAGVDSIIVAAKGEFKGTGTGQPFRQHSTRKSTPSFFTMVLGAVVAVAVAGLFSRYLGGAVGAIGAPLATYLAFPGIGLVTLMLLAAGGLTVGFLLSMAVSGMLGGGGGGGYGGFGGGWGGGFYGGGGGSSGGDDGFSGGGGGFDGGGSSDDF